MGGKIEEFLISARSHAESLYLEYYTFDFEGTPTDYFGAFDVCTVPVWITHGLFNKQICLTHYLLSFLFSTTK